MSDHVSDAPSKAASSTPFAYPFAAAPDIIRSHQKDAYFQGALNNHISSILRQLKGVRFTHKWATETSTFANLLYLSLTTLIGNRTLGEEYCDIVQIEDDTFKLPSIARRAGYILSAILLPYGLNKILPAFRAKLRHRLERNIRRMVKNGRNNSYNFRIQSYILSHLNTLTSPSPVHALTLTIFYFTGSYYELSKRLWGLRYIFTKAIQPSEARIGYEVLGVLLVLQIAVQSWIHLHNTLLAGRNHPVHEAQTLMGSSAVLESGIEVSLNDHAFSSNTDVLLDTASPSGTSINIAKATHTPAIKNPRVNLTVAETMAWIKGDQQRRCTLCLEELRDPSATQCGHVFCWTCIGDWVREKPECPLCRRACLVQHILPLRS